MKEYIVVTRGEGEVFQSVKTEKELAELWETNDEVGYLDEILAFQFNSDTKTMEPVDVYQLATAYLRERNEMEQEYRDYCEAWNEYGPDFESMN